MSLCCYLFSHISLRTFRHIPEGEKWHKERGRDLKEWVGGLRLSVLTQSRPVACQELPLPGQRSPLLREQVWKSWLSLWSILMQTEHPPPQTTKHNIDNKTWTNMFKITAGGFTQKHLYVLILLELMMPNFTKRRIRLDNNVNKCKSAGSHI